MSLRPSQRTEARIAPAALTPRATIQAARETPSALHHGEQRRARVRFVTVTVAVPALMLAPDPLLAAHAVTIAATQPGPGRGEITAGHVADLGSGGSRGGLWALHNQLLGTDPPDRAQLATGPARVTLTFDLPAQQGLSTIIVTGPDGHQWQAGPATEQDTTVIAPVRPLGPAGEYTVAWRIISADGHPVRGTFQFTLTTPGTGTPATPPPSTDRAAPATGGLHMPGWPWLTGAGALLAASALLGLRARLTRHS